MVIPKTRTSNRTAKVRNMSPADNEFTTIREYIKKLRECAEFLTKSADDVEKDIKDASASSHSSSSDNKKDREQECDRIRKYMKKICKEVKQKVHNLTRILMDEDNLDEEDSFNDTLTSSHLPSDSQNVSTKSDKRGLDSDLGSGQAAKGNGSNTGNPEGKPVKIRLVAIEKLLDPNVAPLSCNKGMFFRELSPPPTFTISNFESSRVIVLDSDDDMPINSTTDTVTKSGENMETTMSVTNQLAEQALPKVKPLKVRILKCKVLKQLVKAGKRKIKVSIYKSKSGWKTDDSAESSSVEGASSDDDFVYVPKKTRSHYGQSRRAGGRRESLRRRRSETSKTPELRVSSRQMRQEKLNYRITDEDSDDEEETVEWSIRRKKSVPAAESSGSSDEALINIKRQIGGGVETKKVHPRRSGNTNEEAESNKENAVQKSNKTGNAAAESSSSSDEALINIKRKIVTSSQTNINSKNDEIASDEEMVKKKHYIKRIRTRFNRSRNQECIDDDVDNN